MSESTTKRSEVETDRTNPMSAPVVFVFGILEVRELSHAIYDENVPTTYVTMHPTTGMQSFQCWNHN
jgi:hypothetical protein